MNGFLLAYALFYVMLGLSMLVARKRLRRSGRSTRGLSSWGIEIWAIGGIILVAAILGNTILQWGKVGVWPSMVQFMLGGWPNEYDRDLSTGQVAVGVILQVAFAFSLPILLVGVLYRQLTRSITMRIVDFIGTRDKITATQIYFVYRQAMRDLVLHNLDSTIIDQVSEDDLNKIDEQCWLLAQEAIARVKRDLDARLPEDTTHSLFEGDVVTRQDEERFARVYGR